MSRSFKRHAIKKDNGKSHHYNKKQANKKVRRTDVSNGCMYKTIYNQYNICDYRITEWRVHKWYGLTDEAWEWIAKLRRK